MRHAQFLRAFTMLAAVAAASTATGAPRPQVEVRGLPVIAAQANDPRIMALEEQIRQLNGRLEEMNFQILQMQDQMNKMKEDNDFRFQELEGGKSQGAAPAEEPQKKSDAAPAGEDATQASAAEAPASGNAAAADQPADTAAGGEQQAAAGEDAAATGAQPKILGTVTFDAKGAPSGATIEPGDNSSGPAPTDGETVSALPRTENPEELYRTSYQFILSGDYKTAETGFRDYVTRFPDDARASDAQYWLGESVLGQERYKDAAEIFLAASKQHPKARKAPDMLLKLGVSLAALNQRDVACATFGEIGKRYPGISDALKGRVAQEQALAGC